MVGAPIFVAAGNQVHPAATTAGNVPDNSVASSHEHTSPATIYATPNAAISTLLPYNGLPPTSIAVEAPYQPATTTIPGAYPLIPEGYPPVSIAYPAAENRTVPSPYPQCTGAPTSYNATASPTLYPPVNPATSTHLYPPYALYPPQPCASAPPSYPPQLPPHAPSGYPPVSSVGNTYPPPPSRDHYQHQQHTDFSGQPQPSSGVYPPPAAGFYPPRQY